MNLGASLTLEAIYATTCRVSFNDPEVARMRTHLDAVRRAGLDLRIDVERQELEEMLREGVMLLQSRDLETDFALVKLDAGRGFLGEQKSKVLTYTSNIYRNQFFPGPVLKGIVFALAGINQLYRLAGLLP